MQTATQASDTQVRWASGLNILAGLWLIISPWVLGFAGMQSAMWNDVILGIAVAGIGALRAGWLTEQPWLSWVNLVLGAWVFVSAWVLSFASDTTALWNSLIVGVIVFVLAGWSALGSPRGTNYPTPSA